jgi:hypothetical protein
MHYHRQNVAVGRAFRHSLTSIILILSFPLTHRLILKMVSQTNCICYHRYKRIYAFSLTDRQNIYSTPQTQCINDSHRQAFMHSHRQTLPIERAFMYSLMSIISILLFQVTDRLIIKMFLLMNCIEERES